MSSSTNVGGERPSVGAQRSESPVLIRVWELLDPGHGGEVLERLDRMLSQMPAETGFVSARVLQSVNGRSIAVVVEMRTVEDRQRLAQLPFVRETLEHLDHTMNMIISLYHQVHEYRA